MTRQTIAWSKGLFLLAMGCSGPAETRDEPSSPGADLAAEGGQPLTVVEQMRVTNLMKTRGYDPSVLAFGNNGMVAIEGDILMDGRDFLANSAADFEKGYWKGPLVSSVANIWLVADPASPTPLTGEWIMAFVTGGADWNAKTDVNFRADMPESNGMKIKVRMAETDSFGDLDDCMMARSEWPKGGNPGAIITLNSLYICFASSCGLTIQSLTWEQKVRVAAHELGHTLGFAHPQSPSATHISNTASGTSYSTVMHQGASNLGCIGGNASGTLTPDDVLSADIKY